MIIGIDFSIKSPALCILNRNNEIFFGSVARKSVFKKGVAEALTAAGVDVLILDDEKPLPKKASLEQRERSSFEDSIMQTAKISDMIKKYEAEDIRGFSDHELYIGIEGFSFGSTGNRLAQISGYQYTFRYILYSQHFLQPANFFVYAPMTIKAVAGKGNFKKEQMIEAFLNDEDPRLRNTGLWKAMTETPEKFQNKKGAWEKPIDDLIDSYWVLRTLERGQSKTI
jgi:hypothetical protein